MTEERGAMTDGTLGHSTAHFLESLHSGKAYGLWVKEDKEKECGNRFLRVQENGSGSGANSFIRVG